MVFSSAKYYAIVLSDCLFFLVFVTCCNEHYIDHLLKQLLSDDSLKISIKNELSACKNMEKRILLAIKVIKNENYRM